MTRVPKSLTYLTVPQRVLDRTWTLLREAGREGLEAAVLWSGHVADDRRAVISSAIRPRQIAYLSEHGVAVELDSDALTEIIGELDDETFILVRVHTHPGDAYHSHVDDHNTVIGHLGAVSIVVPNFAVGPATLTSCSINVLTQDGWVELTQEEVQERFTVT